MDFGQLGIIEELEEGGDRRYTYDQGTVKNKVKNQALKELKDKMMRNTAYKERGFGIPTNYMRSNSKQTEADKYGGDISQLMHNQYERDYIEQARQMDAMY